MNVNANMPRVCTHRARTHRSHSHSQPGVTREGGDALTADSSTAEEPEEADNATQEPEPEEANAYKAGENDMRKALACALESGASVTVTHNGADFTATMKHHGRTRTGHGENAAAAIADAIDARLTR